MSNEPETSVGAPDSEATITIAGKESVIRFTIAENEFEIPLATVFDDLVSGSSGVVATVPVRPTKPDP